jgi:hypothetical protein
VQELLLVPRPRRLEWVDGSAPSATEPVIERDTALPAEGFALEISGGAILLRHADQAGLRYARATLDQLRRQFDEVIPGLRLRDWPDFPVRGYMLDVSRDRVPTRETLERIVDLLALLRINQLQLYTEHTFAYRDHGLVWRKASPITPDDVRWLDGLCRARGIELVPNQNCFGHMARWLAHDAYRGRAEAPDGWRTRAGVHLEPATLAPTQDNASFVVELCQELLACHTSRRINIGCDETFELGRGRSQSEVEARGPGRVFLEHLRRIVEPLHSDGIQTLFWGDVTRKHPELVAELPAEQTIALVWHYEAPGDPTILPQEVASLLEEFGYTLEALRGFGPQVEAYAQARYPYWICPGTSTWNSLIGRLPNARANLLDAARTGLDRGASGYLITDWGDNGHMQPPSVSFAPLAYGAAVAWCEAANRELKLAPVLDRFVFEDGASELGAVLEDLGSAYLGTGKLAVNGSPLFTDLLQGGAMRASGAPDASATRRTIERLDDALARVERAQPRCADADIVRRELAQAIRLARHGARRILREAGEGAPDVELRRELADAIDGQRECWLLRSRPGGLDDSLARLDKTLATYGET